MNDMAVLISAALGAALSIIAFVTIWIKVGSFKGSSESRLKAVEDKHVQLEARMNTMEVEKNVFEKEMSGIMAEIRTNIKWIFDVLGKLDKKMESIDAEKK